MHPPRLFCPEFTAGPVALDESEARHALGSLRLRPGDPVTLFDGHGRVGSGRLAATVAGKGPRGRSAAIRPGPAIVTVEAVEEVPAPRRTLTLIVAGCKGPRLDWLVEKCTELGVTRLIFAEFARSVVHVSRQHLEKLRRTAIEACKQCGRAWLPELEAGLTLAEALAAGGRNRAPTSAEVGHAAAVGSNRAPTSEEVGHPARTVHHLLVAEPAAEAPLLGRWFAQHGAAADHLAAVVGPEGGISPEELGMLRAAGGRLVRLAEHVLRVETAAVAVAAAWTAAGGRGV